MPRSLALVCVGLLALATASPVATPAALAVNQYIDPVWAVDVQRDIPYGTAVAADGTPVTLLLDLYTPRGDVSANRPVFIWAHGGFFAFGDKAGASWPVYLAQRGYVAASINYRLGAQIVTAPVDSQYKLDTINNARADMQASVRWFRANASALRINPERIAVGGSSAGAVTALGVAVNADAPLPGDNATYSSAVCTAVSISGANEPTAIGPADAGAIFHHGTADNIVPFVMAQQTRDAMVAAGLAVSWNEYAGEGHALSGAAETLIEQRTIQWLHDKVATAALPCSPAMRVGVRPAAGTTTGMVGRAGAAGVVSLAAVDNAAPGWVQALPCATTPGASSNLNLDAPAQIRATLAVVPFDSGGHACLFNQTATHLVADVQGYFQPGVFDDVPDARLVDTRTGPMPAARSQVEFRGRPNSIAVISVVATQSTSAGYVQVLACGAAPGETSNLNTDGVEQTRAVLAIVHLDEQGRACVFTQRPVHLVVDLQGYLSFGSFTATPHTRLLDTRSGAKPSVGSQTVVHGQAGATGVVSLTATESSAPGYVQVLPCGAPPGTSSNLNIDAVGQTIAGVAFVHFDGSGTACLFTQAGTHLVADLQGYLAAGAFDDIADVRVLDTRIRNAV